MKTQLRAWGNSRAVRLPAKAIQESGVSEDDELEVLVEDGDIILTKRADREVESVKRALLYKDGFCGLSDIIIESDVRKEAEEVCEEIGLSLQVAIGLFLQKVRREKRIPFELVAGDEIRGRYATEEKVDCSSLYPKEFFDFFGSGRDLGFDAEPEDPVEDIYAIKREAI